MINITYPPLRTTKFLSFILGGIQVFIILFMVAVLVLTSFFDSETSSSTVSVANSAIDLEQTDKEPLKVTRFPETKTSLSKADLDYVNQVRTKAGIDPLDNNKTEKNQIIEQKKSTFLMRVAGPLLAFTWLSALLYIVNRLYTFTTAIQKGEVFTTQNADRLFKVGVVCILWGFASPLINTLYRNWIEETEIGFNISTPSFWIWAPAGLFAVTIAEAFRHGITLKKLEESTV